MNHTTTPALNIQLNQMGTIAQRVENNLQQQNNTLQNAISKSDEVKTSLKKLTGITQKMKTFMPQ